MRRHLNYANVVATLALVFAMSGGALAANHYLITSTKQINPKVLKKLKGNAGKAGANGATGANGAQGPQGKEGTQGKEGAQGKEGPKGELGKEGKEGPNGEEGAEGKPGLSGYQLIESNAVAGSGTGINLATATAKCPSGKKLLGGGFHVKTGEDTKIYVADSGPNSTEEWEARLTSASTSPYSEVAYAICATVAG